MDISPDGLSSLSEYPLIQGMVVRLALPVDGADTSIPVFAEVCSVVPVRSLRRAVPRFLK